MQIKKRVLALPSMAGVKKIGFILRSSNVAFEPMINMMASQLADVMSVHFARLPVRQPVPGGQNAARFEADEMERAAELLGDAQVDVILCADTSGSWTGESLDADRRICERITARTGVPASTAALALVEALRRDGFGRYGLAVPCEQHRAAMMLEAYRTEGLEGVSHAVMGEDADATIGAVTFDRIRQLLRQADGETAQCLIVGCTNLPAAPVIDEMEVALGKPVFEGVAVTLWKALRMAGVDRPLHGWGRLLRDHPVINQLDALMERLRIDTGVGRTTIRLDVPAMNIGVDDVYAESFAFGIPPLKLNSSLNQRSLDTVRWLEANQRPLVQDDCINAEVPPPKALMNVYGVTAQMLAPLTWQGEVAGWISVHHIGGPRHWEPAEIVVLEDAARQTHDILESAGWFAPSQ